ncbi:UNVERIFIED_CONTAM: Tricyclene synthase 0e23, chloroplastic [Sesamum radiatum]|uniref:Tricyclene synthase 0e23, chloroplastic n=1 Tax=Sesamum radiatum TaxID=300843 RepID=A0AAW2TU19_SESRA
MEEVGQLLLQDENENPMESLMFVDAIQRVGVDHHFEEEIEMILGRQYNCNWSKSVCFHGLHDVSLFFRLLRQQGYYVSADVFNNFKGKDGKFLEEVKQDVRGLMALYEAAQLSFHGETILDEAQDFSSLHLSAYLHPNYENENENLCCDDEDAIRNTLRHPQHKTIPRLTAKAFLHGDLLKGSKQWQKSLRELANMDFLIGKSTHQHELLQISKWWKDIGLAEELRNARNQPIKWYTGSMAILIHHPTLSSQRIELTKVIAFIHLLDDIFDLYGTIHQLTLFTHAINRWDHSAIDMLPSYMRMSYKALLDTTNQIANNIQKRHGHNPIDYMKATWGSLCNAFLVEARWFASSTGDHELPTTKEYLENGKVSTGVHVVLVHLFFLLGLGGGTDDDDNEINLNHTSKLTSSIATILRLWDDLGSSKWASLCEAFLVEARWFAFCVNPTSHVVLVHLFFLLGLGGLNHEINLDHTSKLSSSIAAILRLWDDFGSSKDEQQDGQDGSYITCYMKDEPNVSVKQARQHVVDMILNEWRNLNHECFRLNHFSASCFKRSSLNLARMVPLMYAYDENQRLPLLEEYIRNTLFDD